MISRDETMLEVLVFRYMESQRVRYDSATEQTHSVPYNLRYCNRNTRETGYGLGSQVILQLSVHRDDVLGL